VTSFAVIFDFDGVIADTEPLHLMATQSALAARDVVLTTTDYERLYLGYTDRGLFDALARHRSLAWSRSDIGALVEAKGAAFNTLISGGGHIFPGAARLIERLHGRGVPLAIASGAFAGEIDAILTGARLRHHFREIVGAGDYAHGKPAPDPFLEAARRLGLPPECAVAIEDSRWGLESAAAAGCKTIAVTHTYPRKDLTADAVVDSLDEIDDALLRNILA
jgi:beta-phosphoglucomutase